MWRKRPVQRSTAIALGSSTQCHLRGFHDLELVMSLWSCLDFSLKDNVLPNGTKIAQKCCNPWQRNASSSGFDRQQLVHIYGQRWVDAEPFFSVTTWILNVIHVILDSCVDVFELDSMIFFLSRGNPISLPPLPISTVVPISFFVFVASILTPGKSKQSLSLVCIEDNCVTPVVRYDSAALFTSLELYKRQRRSRFWWVGPIFFKNWENNSCFIRCVPDRTLKWIYTQF